jgi:hypothetical protein
MSERTKYTYDDWTAEATRRFGDNSENWKFVCPICQHVASVKDWRNAGAESATAFSCIGRYTAAKREAFADDGGRSKSSPCNYAGGGLFKLNPVVVTDPEGREHQMFAFADAEPQS